MWKPLFDFLTYNLTWYTGAVWPNIWATGLLAVLGTPFVLWRLRLHLDRKHESLLEHFHDKITGEEDS